MLNNKTKYALKALLSLSESDTDTWMSISDLAHKNQIPQKFLEAILVELKNAGSVDSKRGKQGGYFLTKKSHDIRVGEIIRLFNGPLALLPCASISQHQTCSDCDEKSCKLRFLMRQVRDVTAQLLDNTSLADLNNEAIFASFYTI